MFIFLKKAFIMPLMLLRWFSFLLGFLAHIRVSKRLSTLLIKVFCYIYNIDVSEAEKDISEYRSIGEFFSRKLKPNLRPLEEAPLHPVDGKIFSMGLIKEGFLIQAKGMVYSCESFIKEVLPIELQGGFYVSYYLAPCHYHRVHSPVKGRIKKIKTISGSLWPVRPCFMQNLSDLLIRNKRLVFFIEEFETKKTVIVVMVGALNVGSLSLEVFEEQKIQKGDELGVFRMGSTVVVMYPYREFQQTLGEVKMGESLN